MWKDDQYSVHEGGVMLERGRKTGGEVMGPRDGVCDWEWSEHGGVLESVCGKTYIDEGVCMDHCWLPGHGLLDREIHINIFRPISTYESLSSSYLSPSNMSLLVNGH